MVVKIAPVEAGHRIHIPEEWAAECGIESTVTLEKVEGGILIRPKRATWDEFFADKLVIGGGAAGVEDDESELIVTDDDLLY